MTEIGDQGRFNHITIIPPTTTTEQWEQNDSMVMSWIIENIDRDLIKCFLDYTTTAHELCTRRQLILGPVSLPPVNDPIQREVARGRNIGDIDDKINLSIFVAIQQPPLQWSPKLTMAVHLK